MPTQPNILLILSDQHAPSALGCAGHPLVRTPHLDALASRGTRFVDTSCGNPLCVPSRMTFLTARDSSDIAVWTNGCQLASNITTFVHHLTCAGYETILCGRMHFNGPDQRHGYERRIIGDVHPALGHIPPATCGQHANGVRPAGPGRTAYLAYDDAVFAKAAEFLEAWDEQPGDRPFFMTVGGVLPHCPYICPKRLFDEYFPQTEAPPLPPGYLETLHPFMKKWREIRGCDTLTELEVRIARAAYFGLVTYLDELIGGLLQKLAETRYGQDTIVIYASDHGEMAGNHRLWWKSSFYQDSVGVPMIWRGPGIGTDEVCGRVTNLLDIGPTLVDLAGGDPMPLTRGRSLRGFLESGEVEGWDDITYSEYGGLQGDAPGRMVRRGPWKLNHYHGYDLPQLFNLEDDPGEWHDLGGDKAYYDTIFKLWSLARTGWNGDRIVRAGERANADLRVLRQFNQAARRAPEQVPDRWTAPVDCNVWPEE